MLNKNSRILITGATSGIGLHLYKQLQPIAKEIIIIGRNTKVLNELATNHGNTTGYAYNLANQQAVCKLAERLNSHHGKINILINNAGVQYTPSFIDPGFSFESISQELSVNLLSPVWLSYLLLPSLMQQPQAAIINISSGLAFAPKKQSAIYCASKAGLHSFSQSLRYQLEDSRVKVIEVILPLVDTPMTKGRGKNKISPQSAAEQIIKGVKKNRQEIYVGKAKLLPLLMQISPTLVTRILKES